MNIKKVIVISVVINLAIHVIIPSIAYGVDKDEYKDTSDETMSIVDENFIIEKDSESEKDIIEDDKNSDITLEKTEVNDNQDNKKQDENNESIDKEIYDDTNQNEEINCSEAIIEEDSIGIMDVDNYTNEENNEKNSATIEEKKQNQENNKVEDIKVLNEEKYNKSTKLLSNQGYKANNTDTLKNGIYKISTAINKKLVLDVDGGYTKNYANIQLYTDVGVNQQKFVVTYTGDGYYTIVAFHSEKSLDVSGGGKLPGTNVQQYTFNNTDSQKWIIRDAGNGYYNIISKCNGLYVDVSGGNANCGTNIQMYTGNDTIAQKFRFDEIVNLSGEQSIENGIYKISTAINKKLVLDVDGGYTKNYANIQLYTDVGVNQQKFVVTYAGDGYYTITALHSEKSLDVAGGCKYPGTNLQQYTNNKTDSQKWIIREAGDGYYNIISKCNGLYVDVSGGNANCGTNIQMYTGNNTISQKFKFEEIVSLSGKQSIENGVYKISTAVNKNLVFDVDGGSINDGVNIQLYTNVKVNQQKFIITYVGNGFYTMTAVHSGKLIDVAGGGKYPGTKVQQYTDNNTDSQKWIIRELGDGRYNIISKCNGLYLTASNANCGTVLQMMENKTDNTQVFTLDKVIKEKGTQCIENGEYKIRLSSNNNRVLDVDGGSQENGAKLQLWNDENITQQRFIVTYIGDGYYQIQSKKSKKLLDVAGGMQEGTKVQQYESNNTSSQRWIIKETNDGYYSLVSECNDLCITVSSDNCGTALEMMAERGYSNQKFVFQKIEELRGVDVSAHQLDIDWQKVKKSGIDFAIIRCGYGSDMIEQDDKKFQRNISECERLGIPYGIYIYSYALNENAALSEVNHTLRLIKGYNPELGIWFDMEDADNYKVKNGMPSNETLVNICKIFCDKIIESGYKTGIYASLSWLNNQLNDPKLDQYDKWVAQWNTTCTYKKDYVMWQYTDRGTVDGIDGCVDMDIYYVR